MKLRHGIECDGKLIIEERQIIPLKKFAYSLHPGYNMMEAFERKLVEKTGKTLEQRIEIVKRDGPPTEKERREWLMKRRGFSTNYAWYTAARAEGRGKAEDYNPEELVAAMFSGKKAALLPIYEKLLVLCFALGKDIKACPGKTIVPIYGKHVIAQIKPSTNTRIDFGLALKDIEFTKRLLDTGGLAKKDRITHRIEITDFNQIDDDLKKWLKKAYETDA